MKRQKSETVKLNRIERMITWPRKIARARRVGYTVFAVLLLLLLPIFVLCLARPERVALALVLLSLYVIALLVFVIGVAAADALYGKRAQKRRMDDLATAYFRSLLTSLAAAAEPDFRARIDGEALFRIAYEYAAGYIPSAKEREAVLGATVVRVAAEPVRARYIALLRDLFTGDATRYGVLYAHIDEATAIVRQKHVDRYAAPQRALLEENLWLVRQQVLDRRTFFLRVNSKRAFLSLFDSVTAYVDRTATAANGRAEGALLLPTREEYERHCTTVRALRHYDTREMRFSLRKETLDKYKALIAEYRAFCSTRASVGCPTVDIEKCQAVYDGILKDNERCWHCKRKFHGRYKEVCPRCHHYVCPRCGKCYCDKHIMHRIVSVVEDE
ncbi:MAG: hypothetical protein IKC73_07690 [Clostridia bacterium]|nr:hypothetical protein [Clostridia bacterium]